MTTRSTRDCGLAQRVLKPNASSPQRAANTSATSCADRSCRIHPPRTSLDQRTVGAALTTMGSRLARVRGDKGAGLRWSCSRRHPRRLRRPSCRQTKTAEAAWQRRGLAGWSFVGQGHADDHRLAGCIARFAGPHRGHEPLAGTGSRERPHPRRIAAGGACGCQRGQRQQGSPETPGSPSRLLAFTHARRAQSHGPETVPGPIRFPRLTASQAEAARLRR